MLKTECGMDSWRRTELGNELVTTVMQLIACDQLSDLQLIMKDNTT
jgi:hypothetical protein